MGQVRSWSGIALVMGMILAASQLVAEEIYPSRAASPMTIRQIHSGHSLTDTYTAHPWPGRLNLATATKRGTQPFDTVHSSTIPGSPMRWRWDNASAYPDAKQNIDEFELLVITEAVPLLSDAGYFQSDTLHHLDLWVDHAWTKGNAGKGAEVMLYSTWTGWRLAEAPVAGDSEAVLPFRQRLEIDGARWEKMQDNANANRPEGMPLIYMIPGHRLMIRLSDDIAAGTAPGLVSIDQVFVDDIHLNAIGQYAITCLVYAVIYQRDPQDLPDRLAVPEDSFSPEQARYLKEIAWDVARTYVRSGVPAD